ncbi:MAG: phenylacetate-CoA oxygenase subunit PaaJ [Bacteroidetes bacterium]|nr:phenylacetate-CoA oxygenase subunit PaaJ [Bacteroidota bacterium]
MSTTVIDSDFIREILLEVKDPEIPTISIVDLGIVTDIKVDGDAVYVQLTPTFAGCPALKIMEQMVRDRLAQEPGIAKITVETTFDKQWNTDMITDAGREALLKHGLAPPKHHEGYLELDVLSDTPCPYCGSRNTTLKSPFGPTLCRSLHYCNNCLQAFEGFKPVG